MKKFFAVAMALVMMLSAVAMFASCTGKDENTLVMATNAAFPPYEFKEGDAIKGIDAEIAAKIAEKLGMELEIVDVDFGSVLTGVAEGKYDMGMAGITVTDERKETMDFSDTYATGIQVIIVKDGSEITGLDSLFVFDEEGNPTALVNPDIKVGVQQSTTGDIYSSSAITGWGFNDLNEDESIKTDRVVRYKTGADAIQALKTDKIDCVIIDNEPAKSFVEANEGIHILEGENEYAVEDYAICVKKGNAELLTKINKALAELKADGTIAAIIEKYIPSNVAEDTGAADTTADTEAATVVDTTVEEGTVAEADTATETVADTAA